ncbi:peroxin [Spiromyces aspiralis]|uniref:Peroxin n=1 Tax=Spiromyces aspiralis TaxID=68401 RepID=A0ACC1HYH4_9FUNG|nr:peroxin [Spiromyces aspiralis]
MAGILYYASKALGDKLGELQREAWVERKAREKFEENQKDCLFTVLSLMPELSERLFERVDVDVLISELRSLANKPATPGPDATYYNEDTPYYTPFSAPEPVLARTKVEIWEDIKSKSFVRTISSSYLLVFLTLFVHIQLNVVGRYTYIDSVVTQFESNADESKASLLAPSCIDFEDQHHYLLLSWWLLNRGWRILLKDVRGSVNQVIANLPLKKRITHRELSKYIDQVRAGVESSLDFINLYHYFLPVSDEELSEFLALNGLAPDLVINKTFNKLIHQTRDVLESSDFRSVLGGCLNAVFGQFLQTVKESFPPADVPPTPSTPLTTETKGDSLRNESLDKVVEEFEAFSVQPEPKVAVAQLLPRISRESNVILSSSQNLYLNVSV